MELIGLIIGLVFGAGCCIFAVIEHKKVKQKNHDIELYNQSLESSKVFLEQKLQEVQTEINTQVQRLDDIRVQSDNYLQQNRDKCDELIKQQKSVENHLNELANRNSLIIDGGGTLTPLDTLNNTGNMRINALRKDFSWTVENGSLQKYYNLFHLGYL